MARILVIDGEVALLCLISNTLQLDGHIITETSDPIESLSIVDQRRQEIDLVLTDVETKPISGFEVVKRMTEKGIDIPVLFMSCYPSLAGVISSILGEGAVIEKPFTSAALRQSVTRALAERNRRSTTSGARAA